MADFPYMTNPNAIKKFLEHIQKAGVPDKVTTRYLVQSGFKSTNDRPLIGVLKSIGFITSDGTPTPVWQSYRNRTSGPKVLAGVLQKAYSDLFRLYPDAHRKDNEALRNYFSAHTKVAESTLALIVSTFRALCASADFADPVQPNQNPEPEEEVPTLGQPGARQKVIVVEEKVRSATPAININIQLQLPATDDAKIYDNLFAAMKKYLFP
jgi:Family of unknown function (DUF5343)